MRHVLSIRLLVIGLMLAPMAGCTRSANPHTTASTSLESRVESIMATDIVVSAPADDIDQAAQIVFDSFRRIDTEMSEWKPGSPISEVNRQAGIEPVTVPLELLFLTSRAIEINSLTDSTFACSWAALWGLWDFKADPPALPDPAEVAGRLPLVDDSNVIVDSNTQTIFLTEKGMAMGLGGIAKGYALEKSAEALRNADMKTFLLSAGGQILASGRKADGSNWKVGIRDPRGASPSDYFAVLELTASAMTANHWMSVSTSGDYERYFIIDDTRYHHILDPTTGYPADGRGDPVRSATVLSYDPVLADALSTSLVVLGATRALDLIESIDQTEAILVDGQGHVRMTSGISDAVFHIVHAPTP